MPSSEYMTFNEAVRMVLDRYNSIAKMVEAHKSLPDDQQTNKLLLECGILRIMYQRLGKPDTVANEMAGKWRELCELNQAPETV